MPTIPVKCPYCGSEIQTQSENDASICNECGKPYIVKEAIIKTYVDYFTSSSGANKTVDLKIEVNVKNDFSIEAGVLKRYRGESRIVEIPDNVVEIETNAFHNLKINKVILSDSVKIIDDDVFSSCTELKEIHIPSSVVELGKQANDNLTIFFDEQSSITKTNKWNVNTIYLPDSISTIENKAFKDCTFIQNVIMPNSIISIGDEAFRNTMLKSIVLPNSLISIGNYAFANTSLSEVIIPDSVTNLADNAFSGSLMDPKRMDAVEFNLMQLGYKQSELSPILEKLRYSEGSTDDLVRKALRMLFK